MPYKPTWPSWQPTSAPSGCDLYLPIAAGAGLIARDLSPRGNHAALGMGGTTAPAWGRSEYGPCLSFDGSDDVAVLAVEDEYGAASRVSLLALVYPTSTATLHTIAAKRSGSSSPYQFRIGSASGDGRLCLTYTVGGSFQSDGADGPVVSANVWSVVGFAIDYANPNPWALWHNGSRYSIARVGGSGGTPDDPNIPVTLGRRYDASQPFAGKIGAVVRADRLWSDAEFRSLSADLLSGRFSAVRPRSLNLATLAAVTSGGPTFKSAWATQSNQMTGAY